MIQTGILNPAINSLLSRVRHTNLLVIADRGFPYWPNVETVDISLVSGVPLVPEVIRAVRENFNIGKVFQAEEFLTANSEGVRLTYEQILSGLNIVHEPHIQLKTRVPQAIGIIRTGDATRYGNLILESA